MKICSRCEKKVVSVKMYEVAIREYMCEDKSVYKLCSACADGVMRFIAHNLWFDDVSVQRELKYYDTNCIISSERE